MTPVDELVGQSAQIVAFREQIRALLAREASLRRLPPIMSTGETGSGKGLVARIIHRSSCRSGAQFVEVNGAAVPETLLESELFGFERGAFTDAWQSKPGLIRVAHRGTLFLDEVALLPPLLQARWWKIPSVRRLPVDSRIRAQFDEARSSAAGPRWRSRRRCAVERRGRRSHRDVHLHGRHPESIGDVESLQRSSRELEPAAGLEPATC